MPFSFEEQRKMLVLRMKQSGTVKTRAVEHAFLNVKREIFFSEENRQFAYVDSAFPIGFGQTISQPSTIAVMLELLEVKKGMGVLEVGSGCGYVMALLSELVGAKGNVFGVELIPELVALASRNLASAGYKNVALKNGDGKLGWKEQALFDRILVSAASSEVPQALIEQLALGGRLVAPVGSRYTQEMKLVERDTAGNTRESFPHDGYFVFVPLK